MARSTRAFSFVEAARKFRDGASSPRELLESCLSRIEEHEADVQAFVSLDVTAARAAAEASTKRWRAGRPLSEVDGLPLGVKDVIETAGMPTEMGSPLFAGWRGMGDSATVSALRSGGAVVLGKTVTTEFAATAPGPTRNPWDLARTPGGSSSGSAAAVAAGFIGAGLGTQVVGSILRPAAYCGCVGFKPTVGAINRGGSHDYLSQSCQGVIAATLYDAWAVARYAGANAGGDPGHRGLAGPVQPPAPKKPVALAVLETAGWSRATDEAKSQLRDTIEVLRSAGVEIFDRRVSNVVDHVEAAISGAMTTTRAINAWESRWPLNIYRERDASKLGGALQARLAEGERMTSDDYSAALVQRESARLAYAALSDCCDAVISLTAPDVAPVGIETTGDPIFVVPGSMLGVPAISLPLFHIGGLPFGLQVMGFAHRDAALFATANWISTCAIGSGIRFEVNA